VPFCLNSVAMMSDADQLVRAIKESTYFHVLLDDRDLTRRVSESSDLEKIGRSPAFFHNQR